MRGTAEGDGDDLRRDTRGGAGRKPLRRAAMIVDAERRGRQRATGREIGDERHACCAVVDAGKSAREQDRELLADVEFVL